MGHSSPHQPVEPIPFPGNEFQAQIFLKVDHSPTWSTDYYQKPSLCLAVCQSQDTDIGAHGTSWQKPERTRRCMKAFSGLNTVPREHRLLPEMKDSHREQITFDPQEAARRRREGKDTSGERTALRRQTETNNRQPH